MVANTYKTMLNVSLDVKGDPNIVNKLRQMGIPVEYVQEAQVEKSRIEDAKKMDINPRPTGRVHVDNGRTGNSLKAKEGKHFAFDGLARWLADEGCKVVVTMRGNKAYKAKLQFGMGSEKPCSSRAKSEAVRYVATLAYKQLFVYYNGAPSPEMSPLVTINPSELIASAEKHQIDPSDYRLMVASVKAEWEMSVGE